MSWRPRVPLFRLAEKGKRTAEIMRGQQLVKALSKSTRVASWKRSASIWLQERRTRKITNPCFCTNAQGTQREDLLQMRKRPAHLAPPLLYLISSQGFHSPEIWGWKGRENMKSGVSKKCKPDWMWSSQAERWCIKSILSKGAPGHYKKRWKRKWKYSGAKSIPSAYESLRNTPWHHVPIFLRFLSAAPLSLTSTCNWYAKS